jgi:hypothetical protein
LKQIRRADRRTIDVAVANSLRGDSSMSEAILALHRAIMAHPTQLIDEISPLVAKRAFQIPDSGFGQSLDIKRGNLLQIGKLSKLQDSNIDINYLKLAACYIIQNKPRADAWIELDHKVSALMLSASMEEVRDLILGMAPVDQRSLSTMRLFAALHSVSDDLIKEYLNANLTSHWTQNRLLYPLIYYSTNLPDPHVLDQMLDHAFPPTATGPAEKILTKFLLEPWQTDGAGLAFRCYVALLSHPYDALEYVTGDLERMCAERLPANEEYLQQFELLAAAFPRHRVAKLSALVGGKQLKYKSKPTEIFGMDLAKESKVRAVLLKLLDVDSRSQPKINPGNAMLGVLIHSRWSRYPEPSKFDEIHTYARRFSMLASGRFVRFLATSLFLFSRQEPDRERLDLLSGLVITGTMNPFLLSGPQGYNCVLTGRFPSVDSASKILTAISRSFSRIKGTRSDRVWIKAANWSVADHQQEGRVAEWMAQGRKVFPIWIQPRYLSGLDWHWLTKIINAIGVAEFVGQSDAIYILFMRQLEEFRRESLILRISIEPIIKKVEKLTDLRQWLFKELDADSAPFVRYVLSADTIQKLKLTDNYVAAISYRIALLEECIRKYQFQDNVLEEKDLAREQDNLTSALSRMSVGARQFEIGWTNLADDAGTRTSDAFAVHETILSAIAVDASANIKRNSSYQFSNGSNADYEARNRDWPLILVIGGILDTFLTHPTSGIEAILSVRIRHDALRREFAAAVQQVATGAVTGVRQEKTRKIANSFEPEIYKEVQRWIDLHMHAARKSKSLAFFDFIPTKQEMATLVEQAGGMSLDDIIELIFKWVKPKLDGHLTTARASLVGDLRDGLEKRVAVVAANLMSKRKDVEEVQRLADAIRATLVRRCSDLQEWFKVPEGNRIHSLTLAEVTGAAGQRFGHEFAQGRLLWRKMDPLLAQRILAPDQIRHAYDLLSEVSRNALKSSGVKQTTIRLSRMAGANGEVIVLSNLCVANEAYRQVVDGHPYLSVSDSLFREGNSGLEKIASLTATLVKAPVTIEVIRRINSFHLVLPVKAFGEITKGRTHACSHS